MKRNNCTAVHPVVYRYGREILSSEKFCLTEKYCQHGEVSVRQHSISVAEQSVRFVRKYKIRCNLRAVVRGALLHDYFLYDWHEKDLWHNWHGFRHPATALKNAAEDFSLSDLEKEIILRHMWPLTPVPPRCKEAWIVNLVDNYCSLLETIRIHKKKNYRLHLKEQKKKTGRVSYAE